MKGVKQDLTFVVTCKGRLHHLQQSLPLILAQRGTQTIVVDADCPNGTANWLSENFPTVTVVKIDDMPVFNISRARNAALPSLKTPWVCFIDADVIIAENFSNHILPSLTPSHFYNFKPNNTRLDLIGTVIAESSTVQKMGGYDEIIQGYGGEDVEFYECLKRHGAKNVRLEDSLVTKMLKHSHQERTKYYDQKDIIFSMVTVSFYRILKCHVRTVSPDIDFDVDKRKRIFAEALRGTQMAFDAPDGRVELEVALPGDTIMNPSFSQLKQVLKLELAIVDAVRQMHHNDVANRSKYPPADL
jgi:glycosyltransferase involved in cell wall biosynthesis